jgi:DNA-binding LacI/PurR family transcriptional regulator
MAFDRGPGAKLPTTQELCKLLSTSTKTIDAALRDLERSNVIYRRRGSGIFVSPKLYQKHVRILFNSGHIARPGKSPFWGVLSALIVSEAQKRWVESRCDYTFELIEASRFHDPAVVDELMTSYSEARVHGIMAIGMGEYTSRLPFHPDMPLVTYGDAGHWQVKSVFDDAARVGVEALAARGCKKVAVWNTVDGEEGDECDGVPIMPRVEAVVRSCGLPFYRDLSELPRSFLISRPGVLDLSYQQQGYLMALYAFTQAPERPDGLFIVDDMLAAGVLTALDKLGIEPGVDIPVGAMSNAGSPIMFGYDDRLIFAEYNTAEIVTALFDVLEALMAGVTPDPERMIIKPRLVMPGDRGESGELVRRYGLETAIR